MSGFMPHTVPRSHAPVDPLFVPVQGPDADRDRIWQ